MTGTAAKETILEMIRNTNSTIAAGWKISSRNCKLCIILYNTVYFHKLLFKIDCENIMCRCHLPKIVSDLDHWLNANLHPCPLRGPLTLLWPRSQIVLQKVCVWHPLERVQQKIGIDLNKYTTTCYYPILYYHRRTCVFGIKAVPIKSPDCWYFELVYPTLDKLLISFLYVQLQLLTVSSSSESCVEPSRSTDSHAWSMVSLDVGRRQQLVNSA